MKVINEYLVEFKPEDGRFCTTLIKQKTAEKSTGELASCMYTSATVESIGFIVAVSAYEILTKKEALSIAVQQSVKIKSYISGSKMR